MSFANTFISLSDVDISSLTAGKFLRVRPSGNVEISQYDITTDTLTDVVTSGAYTPSTGQTLVYQADNTWKPATLDVYSAGNGLNKTSLTLNVVAGTDGGLVSNASGVFIADVTDATNVAATHGNATFVPSITVGRDGRITGVTPVEITTTAASSLTADYTHSIAGTSGQITVTGGTGNKANAVINLVATGVTAGVYGNTTHAPRITVDTYGRISSVDTVAVSGSGGSGNASLGFANIIISGQTTVSAEKLEDDLTIAAGTGMALTTAANTDTITFAINPTTAAAAMTVAGLSDVDASGITNGQVLVWNSSSNKFEAGDQTGSGGSNVSLTSFSVTTASPSGNGSLAYNNAGVFTFTPADTSSGGSPDQTLSISGNVITISGNNDTVDLTTMLAPFTKTDTDAQDLTLSGNVISLSKQSGNVDLTSLLVANKYSDADVNTHLNTSGASASQVLSWNGSDYAWVADGDSQTLSWNAGSTTLAVSNGNNVNLSALQQTLSLSANILTISGSSSTADISKTRFYYANQSDFPNATTYHGAIGHSHADGAMYFAHGGAWVKIPTTSDITTANTNMKAYVDAEVNTLIGGANVNLDSLAEVANALANSNTELSTVAFTGNFSDVASRPTIALSGSDLTYDGTTLNLSGLGATGPQGPTGPTGPAGSTGNGITAATVSGAGNLSITYSNTSTQDLGNIQGSIGPQGPTGPQGPAGNDGADGSGDVDQTLSISGNVITISGNNDTVDLTTMLAPYSKTDTDAQDLTLAGNVISLTGQSGNVDLTSILGAVNTDAQDLTISGNVISLTGQSGNVDLTSLLVSGNYNDAAVDSHLNQSDPTAGYVLSWNGSDYAWVAQSGGGSQNLFSTIAVSGQDNVVADSTTDTLTLVAGSGMTITTNAGSDQITLSSSGGGGSGATVQRFKLNYLSSGNLGSTSDKTSLIDSISIDSATGGDCTVTFNNTINYPPASIMVYGYDYTNNKYYAVPLETTMGLREIAGGGSSGSPTVFNGSSTIALKLRLRETETGASRGGFGTTTHAWIEFVVYD